MTETERERGRREEERNSKRGRERKRDRKRDRRGAEKEGERDRRENRREKERGESQRQTGGETLPQLQHGGAQVRVPHDDAGVVRGCGQQGPVGRELAGHHVVMVTLQLADQRVLIHVPEEHLQAEPWLQHCTHQPQR